MTWQSKTNNVCVPDRVQSSSLLCISSSFLFMSTILIRSTTWIRWIPGICGLQACVRIHQPPRSKDCEKLGGGLGTRLHMHLIQCGRLGTRLVLQARPFPSCSTDRFQYRHVDTESDRRCGMERVWLARLARDYHLTGRMLLRRLDELSQLLHEIGHFVSPW